MSQNYQNANRELWNRWTKDHIASDFYDMQAFKEGKSSLNSIELPLLGDLTGKRILHLQCHFGQDTLSMARMGASVVGVDLSDEAVNTANQLAQELTLDGTFIQSDVLELTEHISEQFDLVFTSYGTVGWLPDLSKWGHTIDTLLKPGGQFVMAEFHPVIWMFDDAVKEITHNYFQDKPIVEEIGSSYTENTSHEKMQCITWNHALSEVFQVLRGIKLELDIFQEFDYSPYNCFQNTIEIEPGKFQIEHFKNLIPMVYAMRWIKP